MSLLLPRPWGKEAKATTHQSNDPESRGRVHMVRPEFTLSVKKDGKGSRTFIQLSVLREPSSSQPVTCFLRLDFWNTQEKERGESDSHTPVLLVCSVRAITRQSCSWVDVCKLAYPERRTYRMSGPLQARCVRSDYLLCGAIVHGMITNHRGQCAKAEWPTGKNALFTHPGTRWWGKRRKTYYNHNPLFNGPFKPSKISQRLFIQPCFTLSLKI